MGQTTANLPPLIEPQLTGISTLALGLGGYEVVKTVDCGFTLARWRPCVIIIENNLTPERDSQIRDHLVSAGYAYLRSNWVNDIYVRYGPLAWMADWLRYAAWRTARRLDRKIFAVRRKFADQTGKR